MNVLVRNFGCFLILVLSSSSLLAQEANNDNALHEELRKFKTDVETAMNNKDAKLVLENVEENVIFTTMNNDVIFNKVSLGEYFDKMLKSPDSPITDLKSSVTVDNLSTFLNPEKTVALASGTSKDIYTLKRGGTLDLQSRWTATLSKQSGKWKIAAMHYSVDIFNNPLIAKTEILWQSVAAGLLVLGLAVGYFLGKRKSRTFRY